MKVHCTYMILCIKISTYFKMKKDIIYLDKLIDVEQISNYVFKLPQAERGMPSSSDILRPSMGMLKT